MGVRDGHWKIVAGWWLTYPSDTSWSVGIMTLPSEWKNKTHVPNHQADWMFYSFTWCKWPSNLLKVVDFTLKYEPDTNIPNHLHPPKKYSPHNGTALKALCKNILGVHKLYSSCFSFPLIYIYIYSQCQIDSNCYLQVYFYTVVPPKLCL